MLLELPASREWNFTDDLSHSSAQNMLEFRLVYQGLLLGSDRGTPRSEHKQAIRRYLHKQLVNLWQTKYPLKGRADYSVWDYSKGYPPELSKPAITEHAQDFTLGGKSYVPIVCRKWALVCGLDILLLRRDFASVIESGDLDNRIKTLLDALRIPQVGDNSDGDENPLYCVMEDDKLVSEIHVVADLLLADPEQVIHFPRITPTGEAAINENHVYAVIHVQIKPTRLMAGNLDFA